MAIRRVIEKIRKAVRLPLLGFRKVRPSCEILEGRQLLASNILFNPTGSASTPVASFETLDFAAGSALAKNSLPTVVGQKFQLYYQSTLVGALDASGRSVALPGLNTDYQITALASFTEQVVSVDPAGAAVTFGLSADQAPESFYEIYYNPAVVANNLAGTGFNQGTRILLGRPSFSQPSSSNFALALVQQNPLPAFDSFINDDYPGIRSVDGLGSTVIGSDVVSTDPKFFVSPISQLSFNTNTAAPFTRTNPSGRFVGAAGGLAPTIIPNVGPINGVVGPDFEFQADANVTFTLAAPTIGLVKATDGVVATSPPGPVVTVGSTVTWTYDVTNPGNEPLRNVTVVDDAGTPADETDNITATYVSGDNNGNSLLDPGETFRFTASGVATTAGQYENRAVAVGVGNLGGTTVTATSISHYFATAPAIGLVKATDGVVAPAPPGPVVTVGGPVTFMYSATNPGDEPLRNVILIDDGGTPFDPSDDFRPTYVSGDNNGNSQLDPGEIWGYTATGVARAGQYENRALVLGVGSLSGKTVTAPSISHYSGTIVPVVPVPAIALVKLTDGQLASTPPGPTVFVGSTVTFTYLATNTGQVPLSGVSVLDDAGTPGNPADDFRPTFAGGDTNGNSLLDPGETFTFTATRIATRGQYTNTAVATGSGPAGQQVTSTTTSSSVGVCPTVVDVRRTGVHLQTTRVVVTFNGPLDPAMAEDVRNYRVSSIGPDGRFDRPDRVTLAQYDPATNSVTLTLEHRLNVHHLSRVQVTNPCPDGPGFDGVLNRKYSLGAVTIVGKRGHHFVFPKTNVPQVLDTALLPRVLRPGSRPAVNRLSLKPTSSAFAPARIAATAHVPAVLAGHATPKAVRHTA